MLLSIILILLCIVWSCWRLDLQNPARTVVQFCKILVGDWTPNLITIKRNMFCNGLQIWVGMLLVYKALLVSQVVHSFVEVSCDADVQAEVATVFCVFLK